MRFHMIPNCDFILCPVTAFCVVTCFAVTSGRAEFGDQLHKLNAASSNHFGWWVDVSGNVAIVGAPSEKDRAGAAYLFDVVSGQQLHRLQASDMAAEDRFGFRVAISGNNAIVASHRDDGTAYMFDVATGKELRRLAPSDGAPGDLVGAVAIDGNTAIVGARGKNDVSGAAYLFDVTTGQQLFKLTASDAAAGDQFGWSVDIRDNTAIVGALYDDDGGVDSGSAYLFNVATGQELFKLTASNAGPAYWFGDEVAINGTTALVGSTGVGGSVGAAYQFDIATGQEVRILEAPDRARGDWFGVSVALNDNVALVGAHNDDDDAINAGSIYAFDATTGELITKFHASDPRVEAEFGNSVAISGQRAIVGARKSGIGAAYVFDISRGPALSGDFNNDGTVNATDYVVWRNGLGMTYTQADYNAWRANFGRSTAGATAGLPSSASPAVPEPPSLLIFGLGLWSMIPCAPPPIMRSRLN